MTTAHRPRRPLDAPGLDRDRILDAALAQTRRHGLQGLSMRKLAPELGVTTMALYYHFANKDELVDAITDAVFALVKVPPDDAGTWDERLRTLAWSVHDILVEFPGVADQIYTHQRYPASAVPLVDYGVRTLCEAGFDLDAASEAFDVLASVVITRTHFEAHQRLALGETALEERIREGWHRLDPALAGDVPGARGYVTHLDGAQAPRVFARALDVVLAGLRCELDTAR